MAVLAGIRAAAAAALAVLALTAPAHAVFGGARVADSDPVAHAVAAIRYADSTGTHLCTGVVLAPRLVLTAAHCTSGDRSQMRVIFSSQLIYVSEDRLRMVAGVARAAATPAGKGKFAYQNPDDLALVLLDRPAPAGTAFMTLPGALPSAKSLRTAGYGATSDLREANGGSRQIGFDQILRTATIPVASATDSLIATDQTAGTGTCTGDSGGPAYIAAGKGFAVVGIMIGVASPRDSNDYCRGKAWFAATPRWKSWIETTAASLQQPL